MDELKDELKDEKIHGNMIAKSKKLNPRQKRFLKAFRELAAYNITEACKKANIDRQLHHYWMKTNEYYKQLFELIKDEQVDWVETHLMKNIKDGNVTAQIFFLKTQGKHRGYVEGVQVDVRKKVDTDDLSDLTNEELDALVNNLSKYTGK